MAELLLLAGTGVAAAGQIQAGRVAAAEAKSAQNIALFNAAVQEREAKAFRAKAAFEQERFAKKAERVKGALTARLAAAGGLGAPVAIDLAAEQAAELELESLLIGYEGEVAAGRAMSQAEWDRMQAGIYKRRAKVARPTSYFRAGTTLLTGFGRAFA